ncbi:MAG: mechanosensitive ion channel family protein [Cyclobacteriaceae bacterium]|nr:mechanosensitive ion channel [Cyclobacteriaceae bacterium]MCH8515616.1 mechanosensitive ion channel family protein [Cyclobacteriaceae bacterium]
MMNDLLYFIPSSYEGIFLLIFGALIVYLVLRLFWWALYLGDKSADKRSYTLTKRHINKSLYVFSFLVFLLLEQYFLQLYRYELIDRAGLLFRIVLILNLTWLTIGLLNIIQGNLYHYYNIDFTENLKQRKVVTQIQFLKRLLVIIVVIIAFSLIMMQFEEGHRIGNTIISSAGVLSLVVGFAAQKSIANLLAGFQIAFTQPIRIDDVVIVEGEWGKIEEINLTYVVVQVWDLRRLVLPITYFVDKPFQNWTRKSADLLGSVFIYVDFSLPVSELRTYYLDIIKKEPWWDGKVAAVQVTNATEKTQEIRILMSAGSAPEAFDLRCIVREKLIAYVRTHHPKSFPTLRFADTKIPSQ